MVRSLQYLGKWHSEPVWRQSGRFIANPESTLVTELNGFIAIVGTMMACFAAVMINFSDFFRHAKNRRSMTIGNLAGLPLNMVLFSVLALIITAEGAVVYEENMVYPTDILERADSAVPSVIAGITLFAATAGINLVANFIAAVNGIANLASARMNFHRSGLMTSLFALFIGGFWVSFALILRCALYPATGRSESAS